jgi:hypothetical protein
MPSAAPGLSREPIAAARIAHFDGTSSKAAVVNYSVPLPGSYTFDRILPVRLDDDVWLKAARLLGTEDESEDETEGGHESSPEALRPLRPEWLERLARERFREHLLKPGVGPPPPFPGPGPERRERVAGERFGEHLPGPEIPGSEESSANEPVTARSGVSVLIDGRLTTEESALAEVRQPQSPRQIKIPVAGLAGNLRMTNATVPEVATPRLWLVERYGVAAFLGDYGLGRTVQTFSLLPNEHTTLHVETWRTETSTTEDRTSVFDSTSDTAKSRLADTLERETGSASRSDEGWAVSAGLKLWANFVVVGGEINASVDYSSHTSRENFARAATGSLSEHASESNSRRENSVNKATTVQVDQGRRDETERQIHNINARRTLNFCFRELNQAYLTGVFVRGFEIAFTNGRPGSLQRAPLSDLPELLSRLVHKDKREKVARALLRAAAVVVDTAGDPKIVLQYAVRGSRGTAKWKTVAVDGTGELSVPGGLNVHELRWRFDPELKSTIPHAQGSNVPGVLTGHTEVVLRTDSVIVEALLGEADALDPYATAVQVLDLQSREAALDQQKEETLRQKAAREIIAEQPKAERVNAWEKLFGDKPNFEIVSAATVADGAGPHG